MRALCSAPSCSASSSARPSPSWSSRRRRPTDIGARRDSGSKDARRGAVSRARGLDAVDLGIIEALQRNGRESFRRIARDLGVSEATVRARYGRMCDQDILQVTGVTNPLGLGFDAQAMIGVRTAGPPGPVADAIAAWEESAYVVVTAGHFDLLVEVLCTDRAHLFEVTNRLRELEGVSSTETFLYLDLWKQAYDWGAPVPGAEGRHEWTRRSA